jgi:biotin carboxylase
MPDELPLPGLLNAVSYAARPRKINRIVALDQFDMENVSAIREHLRIPGMGLTTVRYFRDKLAMRMRAKEAGVPVPEFVHVLNHDELQDYMARVPALWLLKPRSQASGIGMKKIYRPYELWPWLDKLGDEQSHFLLEQFVPGSVFHVDSVVNEREVLFADAHAYGVPPLDVSHAGGVFTTRTVERDSADAKALQEMNKKLIESLGLLRGVTHAKFLKPHPDGNLYFIEIAARLSGDHITDVVESPNSLCWSQ